MHIVNTEKGIKDKDFINEGYIPCESSLKNNEITEEYEYINDYKGWKCYKDTYDFLIQIQKIYLGKIHCKPKIKVLEDGLIIGIITESNHFIELNKPQEDLIDDDLKKMDSGLNTNNGPLKPFYYNHVNQKIVTNGKDEERIETVKNIDLEYNFYNSFRNKVKQEINKPENIKTKKRIEGYIDEKDDYYNKFKKIKKELETLIGRVIKFTNYDKKSTSDISQLRSCSESKDSFFCLTNEDSGELLIHNTNKLSGGKNKEIYYQRITDELLRYSRISSFILKSKSFLSFQNINYNLGENEIIILETLFDDYFENITDVYSNPYVKQSSFYTTNPLKNYNKNNDFTKKIKKYNCGKKPYKIEQNVTGDEFKELVPKSMKEYKYTFFTHTSCTFQVMIDIIEDFKGEKFTSNDLKDQLLECYLDEKYDYGKILSILKFQGKLNLVNRVIESYITFENFILNEQYYLTNLDIWILSEHFKIPIVLYSQKYLLETEYTAKSIYINNSDKDYVYILKVPAIRVESLPINYKLCKLKNKLKINKVEIPKLLEIESEPIIVWMQNFNFTNMNKLQNKDVRIVRKTK